MAVDRQNRSARRAFVLSTLCVLGGTALLGACSKTDRVVVGSKNFTEQVILGELIAQHLEKHGIPVDRRLNLGGTFICHQALVAGQLDIYVEYTGTALVAILKEEPSRDPAAVYGQVRAAYAAQYDLEWTEPLGFNNTFAVVVRRSDAEQFGLSTISDAVPHTRDWTAGFGYEFMEREDGFRGLAGTYGLEFHSSPKVMDLGLTYRALADGQVDLIAGNSTDGLIDALGLVILGDDRSYFPPYEAVPVVRRKLAETRPEIREALRALDGAISEGDMRRLNYQVDGERRDVGQVVGGFLSSRGL